MLVYMLTLLLPLLASATMDPPKMNVTTYWTAYLNMSYIDTERKLWHTERTETGRFSSAGVGKAAGVAVEVRAANDTENKTGCEGPFEQNYPKNGPWIAIIERGDCTFNQKIANALALKASGVLIYDNEDGGKLQSMKVTKFSIPSVFTYRWKGKEILKLSKQFHPVYLVLEEGSFCRTQVLHAAGSSSGDDNTKNDTKPNTMLYCTEANLWDDFSEILRKSPGSPFWHWNLTGSTSPSDAYDLEKRTSVLFVSISFVVLMVISLAWLLFYYIQRFRYMTARERLERKLSTQAKRALNFITTSVLKKDDLEMKDFEEMCAVCIETYREADVVRILPCRHQFHKSCIDQWLLEKRTCPMCKMDILKHYGLVEEEVDTGSDIDEAALSLT